MIDYYIIYYENKTRKPLTVAHQALQLHGHSINIIVILIFLIQI